MESGKAKEAYRRVPERNLLSVLRDLCACLLTKGTPFGIWIYLSIFCLPLTNPATTQAASFRSALKELIKETSWHQEWPQSLVC